MSDSTAVFRLKTWHFLIIWNFNLAPGTHNQTLLFNSVSTSKLLFQQVIIMVGLFEKIVQRGHAAFTRHIEVVHNAR